MPIVTMAMMTVFIMTTHAVSLDYSGGSSSNNTGAVATTSGFSVSYSDTNKNICGYRFSIVTSTGTPKSGTKVVNIYLSDKDEGTSAYSSAERFIISSGKIANKKQLANGTKVSSTSSKQSCDYKSGNCGFYSTLPQNSNSVGSWIKSSANSYQNLSRIYVLCGTSLASASESDYVLIEPVFRLSLAGKKTAATSTELAIYGAAVSGGDGYNGGNGNLYNAGSGTLWNIMYYVNREFPNSLYVSSKTDVYSAVTIKTSDRYTYRQIIQKGYGCSVLTVKNVIPIKKVYIAYHPNGGSTTKPLNEEGYIVMGETEYFHSLNHGTKGAPYKASTFELTRIGYTFIGWQVLGTSTVLNQDTEYESTQYSHYNDSTKTTANTTTVYCHLIAVWELSEKIVIVPIEPNATYRENTDVISSFWLVNISGDDYTPTTGAKVVFSVYNASGEKITEEKQSFVAPNNDKNLAFFKWHVPDGYGGSNITIKANIVEGEYQYNHIERSYRVAFFDTLTTPNTSYKNKAPEGFSVPSVPSDNSVSGRWWQYSYSGGAFVKKDYAVGNTVSDVTLTTPTNPTAYTSNGKLYMKSGYGFECSYTHSMASISGYQSTSASQSVAPQYFYALFPEYNYTYGANLCRSFEAVSGRKVFVNATGMNRQHFTPIYYPDGEYRFQIVLSDCWTPAGMLTTYKTVTIQIDGNMYDDWYVGRK